MRRRVGPHRESGWRGDDKKKRAFPVYRVSFRDGRKFGNGASIIPTGGVLLVGPSARRGMKRLLARWASQ